MSWEWTQKCSADSFVNCRFGDSGHCHTHLPPRRQYTIETDTDHHEWSSDKGWSEGSNVDTDS